MKTQARMRMHARYLLITPLFAMLSACGAGADLDANPPAEVLSASHEANWTPDRSAIAATDAVPAVDVTGQAGPADAVSTAAAGAVVSGNGTAAPSTTSDMTAGPGTATGALVPSPSATSAAAVPSAQLATSAALVANTAGADAGTDKQMDKSTETTAAARAAAGVLTRLQPQR